MPLSLISSVGISYRKKQRPSFTALTAVRIRAIPCEISTNNILFIHIWLIKYLNNLCLLLFLSDDHHLNVFFNFKFQCSAPSIFSFDAIVPLHSFITFFFTIPPSQSRISPCTARYVMISHKFDKRIWL